MNLKALSGSGSSDNVGSDRSERKDLPTSGPKGKAEALNKDKVVSPSKTNGDERDILDQIDDIVNDKKVTDKEDAADGESASNNNTNSNKDISSDHGSEEEDDVLIINEDGPNEEKDSKSDVVHGTAMDSKQKATPVTALKNPLRIGAKVRSTVNSIMAKLVQTNPDVNNLVSKTKSEGSVDSGGSRTSSPLTVRQDKGNLFDNFDVPDWDSKSPKVSDIKDAKSPRLSSASASTEDAVGKPDEDTCLKNGSGGEKDAAEKTKSDKLPTTEELSQSSDRSITTPTEKLQSDQEESCGLKPVSSADSLNEKLDSKEVVGECEGKSSPSSSQEKGESLEKCEVKVADPVLKGCALKDNSSGVAKRASSPAVVDSPKLTDMDTSVPESEAQDTKPMETAESEPCDKVIPEAAGDASPSVADKTSSEDRKRQHDSRTPESDVDDEDEDEDDDDDDSQPPKRSRLDEVIGKLGERVPLDTDSMENDSFDYEDSATGDADDSPTGDAEESPPGDAEDSPPGDVEDSPTCDAEDSATGTGDAESVEKQSEEINVSVSEEEEEKVSSPESNTIKLSKQELEALVVTTAKAAIERYQSSEILALNRRIEELVQSEEEWRQKAKSLERQVLDLTVLQQRLEKRKAHTAALKSITTRSIGVGVTEDKLKTNTPQKQSGTKTPPATPPPATPVSTLVWTSAGQAAGRLLTSTSTPQLFTPNGGIPATSSIPARNTSVAHLLSQTARMPTAASCAAATRATPPKLSNTMSRPASVTTLSNSAVPMSKGPNPAGMPSTSLVLVNSTPSAVGSKAVTSQLIGTPMVASAPASNQVKIIDLTMEDDGGPKQLAKHVVSGAQVRGMMPQQVVRQLTPMSRGVSGVPSSAILLSSPAGTQVVNTASLQRPGLMQPFQVVTIANASNLRPGSLVTVVSSQAGNMVRQPSLATTLTTTARESAPRLVTQQLPVGMTFAPPGTNSSGVRATSLPPGGTVATVTGARMPVALTTVSQSASRPGQTETVATPATGNRPVHPAPLPPYTSPHTLPADAKAPPPRPGLKISRVKQGIVLSWNMVLPNDCVEIASYQLFAYQETNSTLPLTSLWKKVGDVKALPLPMACTLTQFQDGNKYHFAVRAIDVHGRSGQFSEPSFIYLTKAA
ncbi:hypothetical protein V1264_012186 [Littorina saxatilis]